MGSFAQRFALNAENQLKAGSTWLAIALVPIFIALAQMPGLKEAIDKVPLLAGYGAPIAALLAILAAKFRPSASASSQEQALAAEIVRLTLNKALAAHGVPEIPPPPGGVPLPHGMVVPALPPPPAAPPPPPVDPVRAALARFNPQATQLDLDRALAELRATRAVDIPT